MMKSKRPHARSLAEAAEVLDRAAGCIHLNQPPICPFAPVLVMMIIIMVMIMMLYDDDHDEEKDCQSAAGCIHLNQPPIRPFAPVLLMMMMIVISNRCCNMNLSKL